MALRLNYDMRGHEIVEGEGLKDMVTIYTRWGFSKARQCVHTMLGLKHYRREQLFYIYLICS
ncbi:hypothetical protein I7I48_04135 [Histoplasma ohiense]|nr:hypothetical protein I7I48_04135 [Histoplasma ohiense (nom. inval.)]